MKSEQVTRAWEFYRDNCAGFKEPMRKEMRKLDDYVASVEAENAKLRELCSELLRMAESNDPDFLHWPEIHDELRKVGVEIVQL